MKIVGSLRLFEKKNGTRGVTKRKGKVKRTSLIAYETSKHN
jgi:hypothetical protein